VEYTILNGGGQIMLLLCFGLIITILLIIKSLFEKGGEKSNHNTPAPFLKIRVHKKKVSV